MHLPVGHTAIATRNALTTTVQTLARHLWKSLTWDEGSEIPARRSFTIATDIPVYLCDPASPWRSGSNKNTDGLLRQYNPKGTDLATHTPVDLAAVAIEPNSRPRETLGWEPQPSASLSSWPQPVDLCVATTPGIRPLPGGLTHTVRS